MPTGYASVPVGIFTKTLKEVFMNEVKSVQNFIPLLYNMSTTELIQNKYQSFAGLGTASQWTGEEAADYDTITTLYETTITQVFYRKAIAYTWKMKQYEQYGLMKDMVKSLAIAMAQTKQVYAHAFLNAQLLGTSGTYWNTTEGDYLFSSSHTLASGDDASNLVSGALSVTKLQEAIYLLSIMPDDQNIPMNLKPKRLFVHPYNYANAVEVVNKGIGFRSDAVERVKNTFDEYGIQIVSDPYIGVTTSWMLQADKHKAICEVSVDMQQNQKEDFDDHSTHHDAIFAFNVGAKDWRGWVGGKV